MNKEFLGNKNSISSFNLPTLIILRKNIFLLKLTAFEHRKKAEESLLIKIRKFIFKRINKFLIKNTRKTLIELLVDPLSLKIN
jgi:pyruvate/2-oxoglutarate dehydrogenase complex dihydrolipoamide dehydrogenase (E3) component